VTGTPTAKAWEGTQIFTVTAKQGDYNSITSAQVSVVVTNPCKTAVIETDKITDMTTTLLVSKGQTFTNFSDSVADVFGAGTCGALSYEITKSDGVNDVEADLLTLSGQTLTLSTTNTAYEYNTYTIRMHIMLTEYSISQTDDFTITI